MPRPLFRPGSPPYPTYRTYRSYPRRARPVAKRGVKISAHPRTALPPELLSRAQRAKILLLTVLYFPFRARPDLDSRRGE
jgi:hypothetical protein